MTRSIASYRSRYGARDFGFTLIEVMVTVVIVSVLASMILPLTELAVRRNKEAELRADLREIRSAIDSYKAAWDEGHIARIIGDSGYPPSLQALVEGVPDAKDPMGHTIRFLRRVPRDPFLEDTSQLPSWGERSYNSDADDPREGDDVYDVYSRSEGRGINGIPYRQW